MHPYLIEVVYGLHFVDVLGPLYQWDALGNLRSRTEQSGNKNLSESFSYTALTA